MIYEEPTYPQNDFTEAALCGQIPTGIPRDLLLVCARMRVFGVLGSGSAGLVILVMIKEFD